MKIVFTVFYCCIICSCKSQNAGVPLEDQKLIQAFFAYIEKGDYSQANEQTTKLFYFSNIDSSGVIYAPSYGFFVEYVSNIKETWGSVNVNKIRITPLNKINNELIKKLDPLIRSKSYKIKRGRNWMYMYINNSRIESIRLVSFGGEPRFWGF